MEFLCYTITCVSRRKFYVKSYHSSSILFQLNAIYMVYTCLPEGNSQEALKQELSK